jgi:hypothetical protein
VNFRSSAVDIGRADFNSDMNICILTRINFSIWRVKKTCTVSLSRVGIIISDGLRRVVAELLKIPFSLCLS